MAEVGYERLPPASRRDALEVAERECGQRTYLLEKDTRVGLVIGTSRLATPIIVCNHYTPHRDTLAENNMGRRVNIMMDEDAWRVIRRLPRGTRSRAVNAAILEWSGASMRRDAAARMDALRARLPAVETDRIVRWIREDREQRLP